jgi:tetratricopeptide (TPR) repeat protein
MAAAVVSIIAAAYAYFHGRAEEQHARRTELTSLVEKLVTYQDNYSDDYPILARLAPRLVNELPDQVSGPEYSIIARALLSSGDTNRALDYARRAVDKAENLNDRNWARRQLGWTLMQTGKIPEGQETYSSALRSFHDEQIDEDLAWVKVDKAYTLADWGQIAAIVGLCDRSKGLHDQLENLLPEIIFPDDHKSLDEKLKLIGSFLNVCYQGKSASAADVNVAPSR